MTKTVPVGTRVKFYPVANNKEKFIETQTRGQVWHVQGRARVPVNPKPLNVWLDQVEVIVAMPQVDDQSGYGGLQTLPYPASSPWSGQCLESLRQWEMG